MAGPQRGEIVNEPDAPDADAPLDPDEREALLDAIAGPAPPGQRERILAALEAEGQRLKQEDLAKKAMVSDAPLVLPMHKLRVWPAVTVAVLALAAAALLVLHQQSHPHRVVTPGTDFTPGTAAPMPPHHAAVDEGDGGTK